MPQRPFAKIIKAGVCQNQKLNGQLGGTSFGPQVSLNHAGFECGEDRDGGGMGHAAGITVLPL